MKGQRQTKPIKWDRAMECLDSFSDNEMWHELAICSMGFYTGFRMVDYLGLTYSDILDKKELIIQEQKTGKIRKVTIKEELQKYIRMAMQGLRKKKDHYIFVRSRFNQNKPISKQAAITRVKNALSFCGVKHKQLGTHTLRKTFALKYYELVSGRHGENRALDQLRKILNHANVQTTRMYIGIEEKELQDIFKMEW